MHEAQATASTRIGWQPNATALAVIHIAIFEEAADGGGTDDDCVEDNADAMPAAAARHTCITSLCPTATAPMTTAACSNTLVITIVRGETPKVTMSAILRRLLVGSYTPINVPSRKIHSRFSRETECRYVFSS